MSITVRWDRHNRRKGWWTFQPIYTSLAVFRLKLVCHRLKLVFYLRLIHYFCVKCFELAQEGLPQLFYRRRKAAKSELDFWWEWLSQLQTELGIFCMTTPPTAILLLSTTTPSTTNRSANTPSDLIADANVFQTKYRMMLQKLTPNDV